MSVVATAITKDVLAADTSGDASEGSVVGESSRDSRRVKQAATPLPFAVADAPKQSAPSPVSDGLRGKEELNVQRQILPPGSATPTGHPDAADPSASQPLSYQPAPVSNVIFSSQDPSQQYLGLPAVHDMRVPEADQTPPEDYSDAFVGIPTMPGPQGWAGGGEFGSLVFNVDPQSSYQSYQSGYVTPPLEGSMPQQMPYKGPPYGESCNCASCIAFFAQQHEHLAQMVRFQEIAEMRRKAVSSFNDYYRSPVCERPRRITFKKDMTICSFDLDDTPQQIAVTPLSRKDVCLLSPQRVNQERSNVLVQQGQIIVNGLDAATGLPTAEMVNVIDVSNNTPSPPEQATPAQTPPAASADAPAIPPKPSVGRGLPPPPPRAKSGIELLQPTYTGSTVFSSDGGMDSDTSSDDGDSDVDAAGDPVVPVVGMKNSPHKKKTQLVVEERDEREESIGRAYGLDLEDEDDLNALVASYNAAHDSSSSPELPSPAAAAGEAAAVTTTDSEADSVTTTGTGSGAAAVTSPERVLSPATETDCDSETTTITRNYLYQINHNSSTRPATPSTCASDAAVGSTTPTPPSSAIVTPTAVVRKALMADAKSKVAKILENQAFSGGAFGFSKDMAPACTASDEEDDDDASSGEEMITSPSPKRNITSGSSARVRSAIPGLFLTRAEIEEQQREVCRELQDLTEMFAHMGPSTPVYTAVSNQSNVAPSDLFLTLDDDDDEEEESDSGNDGEQITEASEGQVQDKSEDVMADKMSEDTVVEKEHHEACVVEGEIPRESEEVQPQPDQGEGLVHTEAAQARASAACLSPFPDIIRSRTPSLVPATPSSVGSGSHAPVCPATPSVGSASNSPAAMIEAMFIHPANNADARTASEYSSGTESETETSAVSPDMTSSPPASPLMNSKDKQMLTSTMRVISSSELPVYTDDDSDSVVFGTPGPVATKKKSSRWNFNFLAFLGSLQFRRSSFGGGSMRLWSAPARKITDATRASSCRTTHIDVDVDFTTESISESTSTSRRSLSSLSSSAYSSLGNLFSMLRTFGDYSRRRGRGRVPSVTSIDWNYDPDAASDAELFDEESRTSMSVPEPQQLRHGAVALAALTTERGSARFLKQRRTHQQAEKDFDEEEDEDHVGGEVEMTQVVEKKPLSRRVRHGFVKKVLRRKAYKEAKARKQAEEREAKKRKGGVLLLPNESLDLIRERYVDSENSSSSISYQEPVVCVIARSPTIKGNVRRMSTVNEDNDKEEEEIENEHELLRPASPSITEKEYSTSSSSRSTSSRTSSASNNHHTAEEDERSELQQQQEYEQPEPEVVEQKQEQPEQPEVHQQQESEQPEQQQHKHEQQQQPQVEHEQSQAQPPLSTSRVSESTTDDGDIHTDDTLSSGTVHPLTGKRIYSWALLSGTKKLPCDVNWNEKEMHLSDDEFRAIFHMKRADFASLHKWRQVQLKKQYGLW